MTVVSSANFRSLTEGSLKCSHSCRGRRAMGREHIPEGHQYWWWEFWMWVCQASLAAACLSGDWWSTDRWRWARRAVSVCLREGQSWWYWMPNLSTQIRFLHNSTATEVLQDVMQSHVDCVIHRPVCSVGKLRRIQQVFSDVLQVGQDQSLKWLHGHRR